MYAAPPYPGPHGYPGYEHFTPHASPSNGAHYYPPPPRYSYQSATPSPRGSANPKVHARRSSFVPPPYFSARVPPYYAADPRFAAAHSSPLRSSEYVSPGFDYSRGGKTRFHPEGMRSGKQPGWTPSPQHNGNAKQHHHQQSSARQAYWQYMANDLDDDRKYQDAPPPYEAYNAHHQFRWSPGTDPRFFYYQAAQDYQQQRSKAEAEPTTPKANQSRPRRASYAARPHPSPPKPKATPTKPRKATEDDARKAGIPAGFSIKNWDPEEEPIPLLGSVFDANSLGKWIYDWTVYAYGPGTPMSDVAGDLWLLLIQLAGKVKRADDAIDKIRQEENRELVEDFLESGERLWVRFKKLLKICEEYMMKAAKRETGGKKPVTMGKNSGVEFVDSIFGRDRELEKTEKLMSNIRLWSMRFDANCDEILRNPAA